MNDQDNGPETTEPAPAASNRAPANDAGPASAPASGAASAAEAAAPSREAELAAALTAAQAQVAEYKDQMLRALAEAENSRRRTQRDRDEALKHAPAVIAKDILTVADNLRRAIEHIPQEALAYDEALANLATGVELTERLLLSAFEKHNIRQINPLGERFDSNFHQAMFEMPGTGQPPGTIVQVMEPGYLIHDRLLRPALVGVSKADAPAEAAPMPSEPEDEIYAAEGSADGTDVADPDPAAGPGSPAPENRET
jgi:molecular chaperone GrpE